MSNHLGTENVGILLKRFAIPAIIANVVNALYNISDQIFIGWGVGYLGNAATNIAFPITTISMALALMIGIGAGSRFNLQMGRRENEAARKTVGTAFFSLFVLGLILVLVIRLNLKELMMAFGATDQLLDYAVTYTSITTLSMPFFLMASGGNPLIRSDGSPKYSMMAVVSGAVLNTVLNPIFIFVFDMGIAGAAWATVISQVVSGLAVVAYLFRFKQVDLQLSDFRPSSKVLLSLCTLGLTAMFNQLSATIVQIVSNNLLRTYGPASIYGSEIPIAIAGIVAKINMIYISVILGFTQGSQPIIGFNYGAKNLTRVKATYQLVLKSAVIVSTIAFVLFEILARPIISLFGSGSELYMAYGVKYLRVFMLLVILNGMSMVSTVFFTAIGKAPIGAVLALTKQVFLLVPLLTLFVHLFGVPHIMWASPLADVLAWVIIMAIIRLEFKKMDEQAELTK